MPPFADFLQQLVGANPRARPFADWPGRQSRGHPGLPSGVYAGFIFRGGKRPFQKTSHLGDGGQQTFDLQAKIVVSGARLIHKGCAFLGRFLLQGGGENRLEGSRMAHD
jgi:hypothetical protein